MTVGVVVMAIDYIIDQLLRSKEQDLKKIKLAAAAKFSLKEMIKNSELLARARERKLGANVLRLLIKKPRRTLSGVTPVAIMIKPEGSCKWCCIYCPKSGKGPKSYTGEEPAALRARGEQFDPAKQVNTRLRQYEAVGHPTDKCELIIMGGTFLAMDSQYKEWFVKSAYDAMNGKISKTLEQAKKLNEHANHRVIGLTIETRPDVCSEKEIDEMLRFGATRVELGVQHPNDGIYKLINRGHTVAEVIRATCLLKNAGFKVLYHIMPGLPGSNKEKDIEMVRELFSNPDFRPDMLKFYPALVIKGTELYNRAKVGEYIPYDTIQAVDVLSEFYRYIPKYVRVMRIQRDIPANLIEYGVKSSNLRELVEKAVKEKCIKMNEIRAREIGVKTRETGKTGFSGFRMHILKYKSSGGIEIFLSFEDKKTNSIAGFVRLRFPDKSHRKEINADAAVIRELRVFGQEAAIGEKGTSKVQHKGLGTLLLDEAERIAKSEFHKKNMIIISGVGVREYYYKKGYSPAGPYAGKGL